MAKRERKERIIFTNYYSEERFNEAKEFIFNDCDYKSIDDIPDDEVWDAMQFTEEIEWECAYDDLEGFFDSDMFVMVGTVGLWNGTFAGGKVVSSFREAMSFLTDCDYIEFKDIDGHFYVAGSHHDGTNECEVRRLTQRGKDFYYRNEGYIYDREMCEKLWRSGYSVLPHFAHKVWGCPKREAA